METPLGAPPASAEFVSHRPPGALLCALPIRFLWGFFVDSLHRKKTWSDFPKIFFRLFEKIFFKKLKKYFRKNLIKNNFRSSESTKKARRKRAGSSHSSARRGLWTLPAGLAARTLRGESRRVFHTAPILSP